MLKNVALIKTILGTDNWKWPEFSAWKISYGTPGKFSKIWAAAAQKSHFKHWL